MKSLRELFRIGTGPSSSHTMAPRKAMQAFVNEYPNAEKYQVTLYGSLAATGLGHLTDIAIHEATDKPVNIIWKPDEELPLHVNGMRFEAIVKNKIIAKKEDYSIGGGALLSDHTSGDIYHEKYSNEIMKKIENTYGSYWDYITSVEGDDIAEFLENIWSTMKNAIKSGINKKGKLPGKLNLPRKANSFYVKSALLEQSLRERTRITAYAYAVAEENASGGVIATAPTAGSAGVVPALLYYLQEKLNLSDDTIIQALGTAGIFGNLAKSNASISGAYVGCQGEIGVACAMAAAAACQILGGTPRQIEYAAEMGLEHHLGLTCDPVLGLVQIPCIERNAHAALRALDAVHFAILSDGSHHISYDDVIEVMLETGEAMSKNFKETSQGGLARVYQFRILNDNNT